MKILQIIPQLASGGGERFTVDLCNKLAQRHEVTLIVLHPLKGELAFYLPQVNSNIKVISLNKRMGLDATLPIRLYKTVKQLCPDIIHTHLRGLDYSIFTVLKSHRAIRCVHTIHTAADRETDHRMSKWLRKWLFKHKWVTPVTISKDSHRSFVEFYRQTAPIIDNGRNIPANLSPSSEVQKEVERLKNSEDTRVIIQLARFDKVKRQSLMARVADKLYKEGFDFKVLMIGREDQEEVELVKQIASPCISILGQRTNPLEYLVMADAYALCSSYEGMPISLVEALGVGTVPVCTPVGGIVNVVRNGENGFLSEDISEEAYYKALKQFLDTPKDELLKIKTATKESYKPFSMTECAAKYESIYNTKRSC